MNLIYALLFFICLSNFIFSQPKIETYNFISNLLNADGISNQDDINDYLKIYDQIFQRAKKKIADENNIYDKHKALFSLFHDSILKKYTSKSYIKNLLKNQEYNCATAVILYYLICCDLDLKVNVYKSPYHVYISANSNDGKEFIIELTNPVDGFDFEKDMDDYIPYLLDYKLITQEELNKKGINNIYKEFISKSEKITPDQLLAVYYTNLAAYQILDKKWYDAYKFLKQAVIIFPDSSTIESFNLVWSVHANDIEDNTDKVSSFLLETIDSIPASDEFYDNLIDFSGFVIDKNLEINNFNLADSIYNKLCNVLPHRELLNNLIKKMNVAISKDKIIHKTVRGEYNEAFILAGKLYNKYPNDEDIIDLFIDAGKTYVYNLQYSGDFKKIMDVADTLYSKVPEIKSVQDIYAFSRAGFTILSHLYKQDVNKAKGILIAAYKKVPDNARLKNALGIVYHELAMAEIRNRNYKDAINLLIQGLKYDPESYDLQYELKLTKDLLPKK